jgi:hypothetical protein
MADLEDYSNDAGEAIYNAALIAAAPDLYEALRKLTDATRGWDVDCIIAEADAALSKARGEG